MGLSPELLRGTASLGFENPTPIQQQVIPVVLETENDIVGLAQTGTGKTAAFAIPILQHLYLSQQKKKVLVPIYLLCHLQQMYQKF